MHTLNNKKEEKMINRDECNTNDSERNVDLNNFKKNAMVKKERNKNRLRLTGCERGKKLLITRHLYSYR